MPREWQAPVPSGLAAVRSDGTTFTSEHFSFTYERGGPAEAAHPTPSQVSLLQSPWDTRRLHASDLSGPSPPHSEAPTSTAR